MGADGPGEFVSQHDIIYEVAPRYWEDGFPIGNGHFGGMVWQPEGIEIGLTKLDVWDRRVDQPPKVPFDRLRHLFATDPDLANQELQAEARANDAYPFPKPLGRLKIDIEHDFLPLYQSLYSQSQRLCLYPAAVECRYETNYKATCFECFVDSASNLLIVAARDEWLHPGFRLDRLRQRISLTREYDAVLGLPETGTDGDVVWIRYPFPDGFEYVLAMTVAGIEHTPPVVFPNEARLEVILDYRDGEPREWSVLAAAATSQDADCPLEQARGMLHEAVGRERGEIRERHRRWWQGFWDKSGIELEDRFLESLWYVSLYQFASTSRGTTAPGLCGLWNMMPSPPWHGDYHGDINMVMAYWGIFGTNHLELGEPYFATFSRLLPVVKQQTQELYGIEGAKYPIATLDTGAELCSNYYRLMQCTSGFYALVFWWRWLYERDREVLREQILPILEETSRFYLALAEERDGVLHFGPSWAPEQGPFPCDNATNDIALIKALWQAYLTALECLGQESALGPAIREGLEDFPPYPVKDGRFLDSYTAQDHIRLNHPGLLAMVVPGGEVDAEHALRNTALRTMHSFFDLTHRKGFAGRRSLCCDLSWPWLVADAAKLGDGDLADDYLLDMGVSENLKPNGMFSLNCCGVFDTREDKRAAFEFTDAARHGAIFWCPTTQYGRERYFQFIQSPGGLLYGMTEMLLQSHGGVIRIFPAVPARIRNCAFHGLAAEGAFEVSARMAEGQVECVIIHSRCGEPCVVQMPMARTWWLSTVGGEASAVNGKELRFATGAGERYVIARGPRTPEVEVRLRPGCEPGVKTYQDRYGQTITLGKSGSLNGPPERPAGSRLI